MVNITRRKLLKMGGEGIAALSMAGLLDYKSLSETIGNNQDWGKTETAKVITDTSKSPNAKLYSLGLDDVQLTDSFWKPKLTINHTVSLPHQYDECERTGRIDNFRYAAGVKDCGHKGQIFDDSDVYKWMEAAAYDLVNYPDTEAEQKLAGVIELIAKSQDRDGYLNTAFTDLHKAYRWQNLAINHELYCGGHLIQAAIAHHRTTGSDELINVAIKWADHVCKRFGPKMHPGAPGHPEVEMALVELYRLTGQKRYLNQAIFFVEQRGKKSSRLYSSPELQDHLPIREQTRMTGHAVRQLYLCCGITDIYAETGDESLLNVLKTQWENFVEKQMYITGGAGSRYEHEAFGQDYELPNRTAYCETCAAIASFMWNWRMVQVTADAPYADVMEQVMFNGMLSGASLNGRDYFYTNPLEHDGGKDLAGGYRGTNRRTSRHWDGTACCPPNMARTLAALPGYLYGRTESAIYIHHYTASNIRTEINDLPVSIIQKTDYPWSGRIELEIVPEKQLKFSIFLRIPGWSEGTEISINDKKYSAEIRP
ncbi:MAG: beta-L-arabinofuranosidase domain-containing protein, partial [bacterium]